MSKKSEMKERESLFEYVVLSWTPDEGIRFAGPGLGSSWTVDEERVRDHYAYLTGPWRDRLKQEADENEASGFAGGNWPYMTWHSKHSGKKHLRFAIAKRPIPQPLVIEQQEDGFNGE